MTSPILDEVAQVQQNLYQIQQMVESLQRQLDDLVTRLQAESEVNGAIGAFLT